MSENISPKTINRVCAEDKQACKENRRRGCNRYIETGRASAAIWWNGWDDAQAKSQGWVKTNHKKLR